MTTYITIKEQTYTTTYLILHSTMISTYLINTHIAIVHVYLLPQEVPLMYMNNIAVLQKLSCVYMSLIMLMCGMYRCSPYCYLRLSFIFNIVYRLNGKVISVCQGTSTCLLSVRILQYMVHLHE